MNSQCGVSDEGRLVLSSRRLALSMLAAGVTLCTGCSVGDPDAVVRAKYLRETEGQGVTALRARTVMIGGIIGGALGAFSAAIPSHFRLHAVIGATVIDVVAVVLLAERQFYGIGAIVSREHGCPTLVEARDLGAAAEVLAGSVMEVKKEIKGALEEPALPASAGPLANLVGQVLPRRSALAPLVLSYIALAPARIAHYVGGPVTGAVLGGVMSSGVLTLVGASSVRYYEEKAKRPCAK